MPIFRVIGHAVRLLKDERLTALALTLVGVAVAAVQIVEAVLFGAVVNTLIAAEPVAGELARWAGLGLLGIALSVWLTLVTDKLAHRQRLGLVTRSFERSLRKSPAAMQKHGTGETIRTIVLGSEGFFSTWLSLFREQIPTLAAIAILTPVALAISPALSATLLVLMVVYTAANIVILQRTQSGQEEVNRQHQDMTSRLADVLSNLSVVRAFSRSRQETETMRGLTAEILETQEPVLNWWAWLAVVTRGAATVSLVVIFLVGAGLIGRGGLSIGEVVTFAGFATVLIGRLDQAGGTVARVFPIAPVMAQLIDFNARSEEELEDDDKPALEVTAGRVTFDAVSLSFPGSEFGLRDIALDVAPGLTVALVGPTGSGKTTLMSLLQGTLEPTAGRVLIDGTDLAGVSKSSLSRAVSVVAQDAGLFDRSLRENLLVSRPDADDDELRRVLERAQLGSLLAAKPGGLDYRIGERGRHLSGGERQRLTIARAMLKPSPILILDEATSALDTRTEHLVQRAIDAVSEDRTTFIVAHRLSTIRLADLVVVLEDGQVAQAGTFEGLSQEAGLFRTLLSSDARSDDDPVAAEIAKLASAGV